MFKTVIWAADGSEASERALPFARELAEDRLAIVHVRELLAGRAGGQPVYADEEHVVDRIRRQAEELQHAGYTVTLDVVTTFDVNAGHAIAELARELDAHAIVVGTRGRGALASALLGSVTQKLLHEAPCPVLAIPAHAAVPDFAV